MTNYEASVDGSGWMSMARTDPEWRRTGVALFLQRQITAHAKQRGVRTLRLWTLANNRPSIRACMKGGFKPICEAAHISCSLRPKHGKPDIRPLSSRLEGPPKSFLTSTYVSKMNGYLAYKRHFVEASRELLKQLMRRKELYEVGESDFILTKPERSFRVLTSSLVILNGPIAPSLRSAREIAKGLGAQAIAAYIPYDPYLLRAAKQLGFKRDHWGRHCTVFEKD